MSKSCFYEKDQNPSKSGPGKAFYKDEMAEQSGFWELFEAGQKL